MRLRSERERDRSVASRGILRQILGAYLEMPPGAVEISQNAWGKPRVRSSQSMNRVDFNVSHSEDYVVIAVARGRSVGVDLERMRAGFPTRDIASRFFTNSENTEIQAMSGGRQLAGFFACWTRKEAYLKARGTGLSVPLDQVELWAGPEQAEITITVHEPEHGPITWTIVSLRLVPGFQAALAIEGADSRVSTFWWDDFGAGSRDSHAGSSPVAL